MAMATAIRRCAWILACIAVMLGADAATPGTRPFQAGDRVLFQGDSITDGGRGRSLDPNHIYGQDYAYLVAARFGADHPDMHVTFFNRGVSGNKVSDLAKRWQKETVDLKPTLLSILIGVNDLNGGVSVEEYESQYDDLLASTVKALPHTRLVLCEPFGLPVGKKKDGWDAYHAELLKRQAVVAKLAEKYHAALVKFQGIFDAACSRAPAEYWIWDGVHPTYAGHQLMADEWVRVVTQTGAPQK